MGTPRTRSPIAPHRRGPWALWKGLSLCPSRQLQDSVGTQRANSCSPNMANTKGVPTWDMSCTPAPTNG